VEIAAPITDHTSQSRNTQTANSLWKNASHPMSALPSPSSSSSLNTRKEKEMQNWLPRFSTAS
jgi:hypothetical protein